MAVNPIDVWNVETFDEDLLATLRTNSELVRNYIVTDREIFLERETSGLRGAYRTNPHGGSYYGLLEDLGRDMENRTIRASAGFADALFEASPFHHPDQVEPRSNKFWMTSHPVEIGDGGVSLLLDNWGGEAVYFWLDDPQLKEAVADIGKPRVIEVAVPLDATRHAYPAGKAVVAAFARSLDCTPDFREFDLYTVHALGPDAVLAVHTEGAAAFAEIGKDIRSAFPSSSIAN
jgi:hypothetical protein